MEAIQTLLADFRRTNKLLIYGHRGCRGPRPENTLQSFEFAHQSGAAGVELDVRQTADGEVIVMHDLDFSRTTQGADARAPFTLPWSEVRQVDLGAQARVPLLKEVIAWANACGMRVNVELKRDLRAHGTQLGERRKLVTAVAEVLRDTRAPVCVSSFDPFMLLYAARAMPNVPRCFIFEPTHAKFLPWDMGAVLGFEGFHPERTMVSSYAVEFARQQGAVVNVWTVNDKVEADALAALGIDGIITDDPCAFA